MADESCDGRRGGHCSFRVTVKFHCVSLCCDDVRVIEFLAICRQWENVYRSCLTSIRSSFLFLKQRLYTPNGNGFFPPIRE